jgi:hypothetical protein
LKTALHLIELSPVLLLCPWEEALWLLEVKRIEYLIAADYFRLLTPHCQVGSPVDLLTMPDPA